MSKRCVCVVVVRGVAVGDDIVVVVVVDVIFSDQCTHLKHLQ